ncbi:unnamed protein product [Choristocarpus tenellus]
MQGKHVQPRFACTYIYTYIPSSLSKVKCDLYWRALGDDKMLDLSTRYFGLYAYYTQSSQDLPRTSRSSTSIPSSGRNRVSIGYLDHSKISVLSRVCVGRKWGGYSPVFSPARNIVPYGVGGDIRSGTDHLMLGGGNRTSAMPGCFWPGCFLFRGRLVEERKVIATSATDVSKGTDIWRDSLLRYLGYANEVGESFRFIAPRVVGPSCSARMDTCFKCFIVRHNTAQSLESRKGFHQRR